VKVFGFFWYELKQGLGKNISKCHFSWHKVDGDTIFLLGESLVILTRAVFSRGILEQYVRWAVVQ